MKSRGFTLVETLLVLALVTLIISFSFPSLYRSRQNVAEREFWSGLRQQWQAAQVRAKTKQLATAVTYDSDEHQIEFSWIEGSELIKRRLTVPDTLLVRKFENFRMHENGYTKPRTEEFYSSLHHRTYYMRIQLAWGGYRIEEE